MVIVSNNDSAGSPAFAQKLRRGKAGSQHGLLGAATPGPRPDWPTPAPMIASACAGKLRRDKTVGGGATSLSRLRVDRAAAGKMTCEVPSPLRCDDGTRRPGPNRSFKCGWEGWGWLGKLCEGYAAKESPWWGPGPTRNWPVTVLVRLRLRLPPPLKSSYGEARRRDKRGEGVGRSWDRWHRWRNSRRSFPLRTNRRSTSKRIQCGSCSAVSERTGR
jgi:hypothetical protein